MVGQNLGAKKPERAERAVWVTGGYNAVYLGVIALALIFAPHFIVSFFSPDPVVSNYAADCLRIIGYGNLTYAFGMVMVQAFNGAGDTGNANHDQYRQLLALRNPARMVSGKSDFAWCEWRVYSDSGGEHRYDGY